MRDEGSLFDDAGPTPHSFDTAQDAASLSPPGERGYLSLRALVRGRVQGVGFRAFVQQEGGHLGLRGTARNLSDGVTVEVVAEGPRALLEALLSALRHGSPGSYVEKVDVSWGQAGGGSEGSRTG